ncbi:MAG: winged helix-turn-helix domain-containing protein [Thermoanaerobaculia bacterium]|nr:winged helix-turn-helix domain-containing protein [Thermoanaerobaculia bacterium]
MTTPASPTPTPTREIHFDEFEVDLEARQLRRRGTTVHIQEKPFLLLEALLDQAGETVSRETLRQRLWPDTPHLDFDASLNVAARKLRRALGDSALDPRWLFTSQGEGYRLAVELQDLSARQEDSETSPGPPRDIAWPIYLSAALLCIGLLTFAEWKQAAPTQEARNRLAIMPFELSSPTRPADLARVSEWLVADLTNLGIDVVGPRSTASYSEFPFPDLKRIQTELDVDFVLNARAVGDGPQPSLLVELIDLGDSSHPWVQYFEPPWQWPAIALEVCRGVAAALPETPRPGCSHPPG